MDMEHDVTVPLEEAGVDYATFDDEDNRGEDWDETAFLMRHEANVDHILAGLAEIRADRGIVTTFAELLD